LIRKTLIVFSAGIDMQNIGSVGPSKKVATFPWRKLLSPPVDGSAEV
jgi:hypothetical protein